MGAPFPNGGIPQHVNGTATATAASVGPRIPQESALLVVGNGDATNNLLISLDGGTNFFTVRPNTYVHLPVGGLTKVWVKSSAATVAFSIVWISVV